jgi:hypothetical protein
MTHLFPEGEPIEVWGAEEMPDGFVWRNAPHCVLEVCNRWTLHSRWWEPSETVWREYLKVVTDSGMLCQIFRDLLHGEWFLARVYD